MKLSTRIEVGTRVNVTHEQGVEAGVVISAATDRYIGVHHYLVQFADKTVSRWNDFQVAPLA